MGTKVFAQSRRSRVLSPGRLRPVNKRIHTIRLNQESEASYHSGKDSSVVQSHGPGTHEGVCGTVAEIFFRQESKGLQSSSSSLRNPRWFSEGQVRQLSRNPKESRDFEGGSPYIWHLPSKEPYPKRSFSWKIRSADGKVRGADGKEQRNRSADGRGKVDNGLRIGLWLWVCQILRRKIGTDPERIGRTSGAHWPARDQAESAAENGKQPVGVAKPELKEIREELWEDHMTNMKDTTVITGGLGKRLVQLEKKVEDFLKAQGKTPKVE
jgi:hypothetical protein